jgi:hypothetical protein
MLWEGMVGGGGVTQETKGSTALKSLVVDKSSHCIVQSANLLQHLRKYSHSEEIVAKLSKDVAAKIPNIKTTGQLLEQMPSVIVALDAHLDSAFQSALLLEDIRSILLNDKPSTASAVNLPMDDTSQESSHSQ